MKDTVLQRAMFVAPASKKTMNSGIMAGFEEDDDMMEEAMAEEMPPMARSPQNPEILMNNLRGDVRSVDARYLELAQMVGEEAAMETPPEVLAMLQGQMGAQAAMPPPPPPGGIGALPQAPQMAAPPMMPPGMEGAAPFPQGGVSAAPPTPDGLPPLRAQDGAFVTQDARFGTQEFPVSYQGNRIDQLQGNMDRMLQLASGEIPPEQMTTEDMRLLDAYSKSMGFTGGSIRDVARQGFGRIGSALEPYVARGREALSRLDEQLGGFLPPSFRVVPMRDKMLSPTAKGRAVIPERDNIVAGPGGMPSFQIPRNPRTGQPPTGAGNRVTAANTLNVERIPLSQAVRESMRVNPKATAVAGGVGLGTAAGMLANLRGEGGGESGMTPEQLLEADRRISQIPNEFSPNTQQRFTFDARDANQYALDAGEQIVNPSDIPASGGDANTPGLKLGAKVGIQPPSAFLPPLDTERSAEEGRNLSELVKTLGEKPVAKTRAQRIKEEYEGLAPMFKEILGDTKSDIRANALLLLGEAGFKYGSTWAPTPAMALSQALSGVPRGFAALAAQARDRNIKIKTATLQSAMDNINLQDKLARDLQLENLRGYNRAFVENLRQSGILKGKLIESDTRLMEKQIEAGGLIEEDLGAGLTGVKKKNGSYVGEYFRTQKDPNTGVVMADPVVQQILDSRYTLRGPTDNPYVVDRGPAPTFSARDKKSRDELLNGLRALDDSLRAVDDLEQDVISLYSPGTWTINAVNNVLVPLSFGAIQPNVEEKQAITKVTAGVNRLTKSLGRSNDTGRVSVYEQQEVANGVLNNLTGPTGFLKNPELAAGSLSSIKTGILNERQQILTQLGLVDRDLQARNPALGTPNSPFVIPQDDDGRRAMGTYLRGAFKGVTDPRAMTYVSIDGAVRGIPIVEFLKGEGVR
jgi:hypothetical protein